MKLTMLRTEQTLDGKEYNLTRLGASGLVVLAILILISFPGKNTVFQKDNSYHIEAGCPGNGVTEIKET